MSHNGIFITIEMLKMMLTMGWRLSNKGNCPMISLSDSLTLSESLAVKVITLMMMMNMMVVKIIVLS